MELVKDIYFNTDKLVENTKVKVSYTGKFYQGNNEKVFLHYGYGKEWDNVAEVEMNKTELGYQAELDLQSSDTLNFCFKNQSNEWDNNYGNNYIFDIEKKADTLCNSEVKGPGLVFLGKTFGNTPAYLNTKLEQTSEGVTDDTITCLKPIDVVSALNNQEQQNDSVESIEIINPVVQQETAIALAPTGFGSWTRKIKCTVCKFFSYVPKLISGNYKRNLSDEKNK